MEIYFLDDLHSRVRFGAFLDHKQASNFWRIYGQNPSTQRGRAMNNAASLKTGNINIYFREPYLYLNKFDLFGSLGSKELHFFLVNSNWRFGIWSDEMEMDEAINELTNIVNEWKNMESKYGEVSQRDDFDRYHPEDKKLLEQIAEFSFRYQCFPADTGKGDGVEQRIKRHPRWFVTELKGMAQKFHIEKDTFRVQIPEDTENITETLSKDGKKFFEQLEKQEIQNYEDLMELKVKMKNILKRI